MKKFLILSFLFSVKAYGVQCQLYGYDGGGAGSSYYRCPMSNREAPGIVDVISSWDNPNNKVNAAISDLTKTNPNTEEISAKDLRKISSKIPSDCWKYLKKAANTGACSVFVGRGHDKSCAKVNVNELRRLGYSYRTSLGYLSSEKGESDEPGDIVEIYWCGLEGWQHWQDCGYEATLNLDGICIHDYKKKK